MVYWIYLNDIGTGLARVYQPRDGRNPYTGSIPPSARHRGPGNMDHLQRAKHKHGGQTSLLCSRESHVPDDLERRQPYNKVGEDVDGPDAPLQAGIGHAPPARYLPGHIIRRPEDGRAREADERLGNECCHGGGHGPSHQHLEKGAHPLVWSQTDKLEEKRDPRAAE